jgi:hypothetical protein
LSPALVECQSSCASATCRRASNVHVCCRTLSRVAPFRRTAAIYGNCAGTGCRTEYMPRPLFATAPRVCGSPQKLALGQLLSWTVVKACAFDAKRVVSHRDRLRHRRPPLVSAMRQSRKAGCSVHDTAMEAWRHADFSRHQVRQRKGRMQRGR